MDPNASIESIKETDKNQLPADLLRHENELSVSAQSLFLFKLYPSLFYLFCLSRLIVNCPSAVLYLGCEFPRAEPSF